jgi:5-hydroxyisourate hydrolase-like protein (transthyretin family)
VRVAADNETLLVEPGGTARFTLDVRNTGDVIDGVSARVIGLAEEYVRAEPELLPLFPEASGQIHLALAVPPTMHAGKHPLTVEIVSHGAKLPSQYVDVDVDIIPRADYSVTSQPRTIRARGSARFVLVVANEGNVGLDVELTAVDVDRSISYELSPAGMKLEPGTSAPALLTIRGPRMITGNEIERPVTLQARATTLPIPGRDEEDPRPQLAETEMILRLRQKPLIARGITTILILVAIIGLWAGVFLLGLTKVFSGDPMTKQAPASFFLPNGAATASAAPSGGAGSGSAGSGKASSGGAGGSGGGAASAAGPPADALPKTGQMPAGSGGAISGKVTATTDGSPVGRILVQAQRLSRGKLVLVSSAATQADGTYTIGGLFPTSYFLEFSAPGYTTVWYPHAPGRTAATEVTATANGTKAGVNTTITGLPASISGSVNAGDTTKSVITTVTARALKSGSSAGKGYTAKTAADGKYALKNLPAPGTYELTFSTGGYQASTLVDAVAGGDARLEPTVTLGAATGQISGTITDGTNPLGGAKITTTLNGQPVTVTTPTTGQVGSYVLDNLTTPGTYVVTYSAAGHGSVTKIINLEAGQSASGQDVPLASGSGTVTGKLVDVNGKGLGGATVTVGGASGTGGSSPAVSSASPGAGDGSGAPTAGGASPTTTTLTDGSIGSFQISGLAVPGSYTLTFALDGYAPATVPITLSENGEPPTVQVTLSKQLGEITGGVTDACSSTAPSGSQITATDGQSHWTVAYSGKTADLPNGGYLIAGLQPGTYSITVTDSGMTQQTGLVTVTAGHTTTQNLVLNAGGC